MFLIALYHCATGLWSVLMALGILSPIHLHDGEQHPACTAGYGSYVLTCTIWAAGGGSPAAGGYLVLVLVRMW